MRTSRKLTHFLLAMLTLALMSVVSLAADPGSAYPATSEVSDQKAGSLLVYNIYTSNAANATTQNTRVNITNIHLTNDAFVHLFFIENTCSIADSYVCLTPAQTASFLASDVDPGSTGYILAFAVNNLGCPINYNFLIGDEYVKFTSGHAANLGAEAFAAQGVLPCDPNEPSANLNFNGGPIGYNKLPRTLAVSNFPSRADGNDTLIIINRIGGNYAIGASTTGTLFGVLYDDAETGFSFSLPGNCQVRGSLIDTFPRTTPRLSQIVPAGRSGWFKIFSLSDIGLLGAVINFNPNATTQATAFNGGRNMHKLTLTTSNQVATVPVFPPSC